VSKFSKRVGPIRSIASARVSFGTRAIFSATCFTASAVAAARSSSVGILKSTGTSQLSPFALR